MQTYFAAILVCIFPSSTHYLVFRFFSSTCYSRHYPNPGAMAVLSHSFVCILTSFTLRYSVQKSTNMICLLKLVDGGGSRPALYCTEALLHISNEARKKFSDKGTCLAPFLPCVSALTLCVSFP